LSGLLAGLTTYYFHQAFTLGRRTPLLLAAMAVPTSANLALNLALIPRFGLNGALWATAASYALGLLASIWLGRGVTPLPIPWASLGQALAASAAMALVVSRLPAWGGLPELGLKACAGALVYGAAAWAMYAGGFRSRMRPLLRRLRPGAPA